MKKQKIKQSKLRQLRPQWREQKRAKTTWEPKESSHTNQHPTPHEGSWKGPKTTSEPKKAATPTNAKPARSKVALRILAVAVNCSQKTRLEKKTKKSEDHKTRGTEDWWTRGPADQDTRTPRHHENQTTRGRDERGTKGAENQGTRIPTKKSRKNASPCQTIML